LTWTAAADKGLLSDWSQRFEDFSNEGGLNMKRILASLVVLSLSLLGGVGCSDLTSTKSETNATTPDRSTTVITEKEARKTGDTNVIIGEPNDRRNRPSADRSQGDSKDQRPAASGGQQNGAHDDKKQPAAADKPQGATGDKQSSSPHDQPTDESKKADKK
jgi:hypothetical protein